MMMLINDTKVEESRDRILCQYGKVTTSGARSRVEADTLRPHQKERAEGVDEIAFAPVCLSTEYDVCFPPLALTVSLTPSYFTHISLEESYSPLRGDG